MANPTQRELDEIIKSHGKFEFRRAFYFTLGFLAIFLVALVIDHFGLVPTTWSSRGYQHVHLAAVFFGIVALIWAVTALFAWIDLKTGIYGEDDIKILIQREKDWIQKLPGETERLRRQALLTPLQKRLEERMY